jgi:predicted ThiF/HesA family dinucleotide-utilizing enzyme
MGKPLTKAECEATASALRAKLATDARAGEVEALAKITRDLAFEAQAEVARVEIANGPFAPEALELVEKAKQRIDVYLSGAQAVATRRCAVEATEALAAIYEAAAKDGRE